MGQKERKRRPSAPRAGRLPAARRMPGIRETIKIWRERKRAFSFANFLWFRSARGSLRLFSCPVFSFTLFVDTLRVNLRIPALRAEEPVLYVIVFSQGGVQRRNSSGAGFRGRAGPCLVPPYALASPSFAAPYTASRPVSLSTTFSSSSCSPVSAWI